MKMFVAVSRTWRCDATLPPGCHGISIALRTLKVN